MNRIQACQIATGLGSGNIGDELMAAAFWNYLPPGIALDVEVFQESARQRGAWPTIHTYRPVDWNGNPPATEIPGLLVGATPVTDAEGLHWPMQFLARRLQHFHDLRQPVDALGVGVDRALGDEARRLFEKHFLPIRSWTVRSESCREALTAHGVPESRIHVGADWAWLYQGRTDLHDWAHGLWRSLRIDPEAPLIVVDAVNMLWQDRVDAKRSLAAALDWASHQLDMQVAFFCNECRSGPFHDFAAALEVMAFMKKPAVVVPNEFYSPHEAVALLECATVAVAQRYHFVIEAVLAGCAPIALVRGEKMKTLVAELSIAAPGSVENVEKEDLVTALRQTVERSSDILHSLRESRLRLSRRALGNLTFLRRLPPYSTAAWEQIGDAPA